MRCAGAHFRSLDMAATAGSLKGNLAGLIDMLQTQCGWVVKHDPFIRTILADGDKQSCAYQITY